MFLFFRRSPTQQSPSPPVTPTNEDLEPSLQGQDDPVLEREFVPIQFLTNRIRTLSQISVPHDLNRLEQHKRNMKEHYGMENWIKLHAEQLNASRTVQVSFSLCIETPMVVTWSQRCPRTNLQYLKVLFYLHSYYT